MKKRAYWGQLFSVWQWSESTNSKKLRAVSSGNRKGAAEGWEDSALRACRGQGDFPLYIIFVASPRMGPILNGVSDQVYDKNQIIQNSTLHLADTCIVRLVELCEQLNLFQLSVTQKDINNKQNPGG